MKYLRTILLLGLCTGCQPLFADDHSLIPADVENDIGYGAVMTILVLIIIAMLVLLRTFKILTRIVLRSQGYTEEQAIAEMNPEKGKKVKKPAGEVWDKLLSLRPLSEEKKLLIAHDYDGIQELDNPVPAWFMYLFYGTIIFGIGYLLNYHVFHTGQLQYEEYRTEMAQAEVSP